MIYENELYYVERNDSPLVVNGETMNWRVVNKQYGTEETTVSALPYAMHLADRLCMALLEYDEPDQQTKGSVLSIVPKDE